MRTLALAAGLSLVAAGAWAQESEFENPTPINFTKPFVSDAPAVRTGFARDVAIELQVIGDVQLLEGSVGKAEKRRPPATAMQPSKPTDNTAAESKDRLPASKGVRP